MAERAFETPQHFFKYVVQENIAAWKSNPLDLRLAFNATMSVDCFAAHILEFKKDAGQIKEGMKDQDYKKKLSDECQSFQVISDVAKALKHVRLTNKTAVVKNATDTSIGKISYGQGKYGVGSYNGDRIITEVEDENRSLMDDCENALEFLLQKLEE